MAHDDSALRRCSVRVRLLDGPADGMTCEIEGRGGTAGQQILVTVLDGEPHVPHAMTTTKEHLSRGYRAGWHLYARQADPSDAPKDGVWPYRFVPGESAEPRA